MKEEVSVRKPQRGKMSTPKPKFVQLKGFLRIDHESPELSRDKSSFQTNTGEVS